MFEGNVGEAPQIQKKKKKKKKTQKKKHSGLNVHLIVAYLGVFRRHFAPAILSERNEDKKIIAKVSSAGAIISSVGAGGQREVRRKSASTRNCPGDTLRSRCASPTEHWRNPRLLSPWLEEDCDGVSPAVSAAAAAAAHHWLPCASARQVPTSAGAGAPRGSNVTSCTMQARAWIRTVRAFADACVQTNGQTHARAHARGGFVTSYT